MREGWECGEVVCDMLQAGIYEYANATRIYLIYRPVAHWVRRQKQTENYAASEKFKDVLVEI